MALDPKNIGPGEQQYEEYPSAFTGEKQIQYDFRDQDGELFSTVAEDLPEALRRRDRWMERKARKRPKRPDPSKALRGETDNRRFQSARIGGSGGVYTCRSCSKRTRETGDGESDLDLCRRCFRESSRDNFHVDGAHRKLDPEGCTECSDAGYTNDWVRS